MFAGANGSYLGNTGIVNTNFVSAFVKNNGTTTYAIKDGDATSGGLITQYNGSLPTQGGYMPMQKEGGIVLGTGGDNSDWGMGTFFEGVMVTGYPTDATENAVQANIVSVGYTLAIVEAPFGGTRWNLPGTIQAENYDTGGQSLGYNKPGAGSSGLTPPYRTDENGQIEATSDTGGGYDMGWTATDDWYNYMVNVTSAGTYSINVRVASANTNAAYHIAVDGTNVTGTIAVPNTGGWQTWQTISKTGVSLSAGPHVLRLYADNGGVNFNWLSAAGGPTNAQQCKAKSHVDGFEITISKNGIAVLEPQALHKGVLNIELFNVAGKRIYSATWRDQSGKLSIPALGLPTGVYLMSIKDGNTTLSSLLIVPRPAMRSNANSAPANALHN